MNNNVLITAPNSSKKPMSKRNKITIISVAALFFVIIAGYFIVSQVTNLTGRATGNYPKCVPDVDSGWEECRYGQTSYNQSLCRARAEAAKGILGPKNGSDADW